MTLRSRLVAPALALACVFTLPVHAQDEAVETATVTPWTTHYEEHPNTGVQTLMSYEASILVLEFIAEKNEELRADAEETRAIFVERHAVAAQALESFLIEVDPDIAEELQRNREATELQVANSFANPALPAGVYRSALDVIAKSISERRDASTPAIMAFHPEYQDDPEHEMLDGHIRRRRVTDTRPTGHPTILIDLPLSWSYTNRDRWKNLDQFRSRGGFGHEQITFEIFERPDDSTMEQFVVSIAM